MAIAIPPFFDINSAYRPNQFTTEQVTAQTLVLAKADVYVDGTLITTIQKAPFLILFGTNYYFQFDVAKVLQTETAPRADQMTTIFSTSLNTPYVASNTDCHALYYIEVTYFYRDATTNQLTDLGVTDTSADYEAIIATRQLTEDMDLSNYALTTGLVSPFLTNRPLFAPLNNLSIDICSNENYFLTGIPFQSNAFQVSTFDANGTPIDVGVASIPTLADYTPWTLGLGVPQLATQTYISGSVNINNPNVAYYFVQVGNWIPSTFSGRSVVAVFNIVECCERRAFRLHFMNRLGGAESYTFKSKLTKEEQAKSERAQKPQFWNLALPATYPYTKGRFKVQNTAEKRYKVVSEYYNENDGKWIAELLSSPETYWEKDGVLVNVLVEDASITISETDELVQLELTILEGDPVSLQQY